jgi:hypothetical protein
MALGTGRSEYKFSGQYTGELDQKVVGEKLGEALIRAGSTCTSSSSGKDGKVDGGSSGVNFGSVTIQSVVQMVANMHHMGVSIHGNSFGDSGPIAGWGHVTGKLFQEGVELPEGFTDAGDILCALAQKMREHLHAIGVEFAVVEGKTGLLEVTFRSRNHPVVDDELSDVRKNVVQRLMVALSLQRFAVDGSEVETQVVKVPFERR